MARITVEDCLKRIPNRFEMVKLAAKRARQIALDGREPTIDSGDDKATVVALREIAAGTVTQDNIQEFNFDIFENAKTGEIKLGYRLVFQSFSETLMTCITDSASSSEVAA